MKRTPEHAENIRKAVQRSWGSPCAQEIVKAVIDHFKLSCRISDYPARPLVMIVQKILDKHSGGKE